MRGRGKQGHGRCNGIAIFRTIRRWWGVEGGLMVGVCFENGDLCEGYFG
jgi:hypothetical protein